MQAATAEQAEAQAQTGTKAKAIQPVIAIQIRPLSFVQHGIPAVLDAVQERAGVTDVVFTCFSFQGKEYARYKGGSFVPTHPQYYAGGLIRDFGAPDEATGGVDWLEQLLPECEQRGLVVYAAAWESIGMHVPGAPKLLERDVDGLTLDRPCDANPDYRAWILSLMEDYAKSYPIAGIQWGSERAGPLETTLTGGVPSCFCEHCQAGGRAAGIDVGRTRQGYAALHAFARAARAGERPRDGYFVQFWRVLFEYPELLQWERLWFQQQQALHKDIYGTVKTSAPQKTVGWHVWHRNSFSPLFRAQWDFAALRRYADWLKPVLYNNCAGGRFHAHLANWHRTWFADAAPEETYRFLYKVLGIDEAPYEELPAAGWSADYVERETRRTVDGVNDEIPVYPGIDIDIPSGARPTTPERVRDAVVAAFRGGARGVNLSRRYSEMRLENLAGVTMALRELGYR